MSTKDMKDTNEKLRTNRRAFSIVAVLIILLIAAVLITALVYVLREVTTFKRVDEFRGMCREVTESITFYQLINGDFPESKDDIAKYFVGGWSMLEGRPKGAEYEYQDGVFTASYTDLHGETHRFEFPDLTESPNNGA